MAFKNNLPKTCIIEMKQYFYGLIEPGPKQLPPLSISFNTHISGNPPITKSSQIDSIRIKPEPDQFDV